MRLYRLAVKKQGEEEYQEQAKRYLLRLDKMLASKAFTDFNRYPTMNMELIYAVIAMVLELKEHGKKYLEILAFSDLMFQRRRNFF